VESALNGDTDDALLSATLMLAGFPPVPVLIDSVAMVMAGQLRQLVAPVVV